MTDYSKTDIQQKIDELGAAQRWNHDIDLPFGLKTIGREQISHGKNRVKWGRIEEYIKEIDVKGKRVLDVGCNEGFFSLKLAQMGAREVVGIDADALRIKKANYVCNVLGAVNVKYDVVDVFSDEMEKYGHFDFMLCMGFLHRVPYPFLATSKLTKLSDTILFEWKALKEGNYNLPVMKYCGGESKDTSVYSGLYWLMSVKCVRDILETLGFEHQLVIDDSAWRRALMIVSNRDGRVFRNRPVVRTGKYALLK
ncbi:MAG: DUF1698 domain-containing protein, partial [Deltaproteobacteria bacterium]|nr:DUF1698 domain-containing protein [Deltaproteobacteria bacterium]